MIGYFIPNISVSGVEIFSIVLFIGVELVNNGMHAYYIDLQDVNNYGHCQ